MGSRHSKRLDALEKKMNAVSLRLLKFTEEDVARWLGVCKKFNDRWPGAVVFSHTESEDVQAQGRTWAVNLAAVVAHGIIQAGFGNTTIKEFIENECPEFGEAISGVH